MYELGILDIYIDDMSAPFLSTIVNMGEMVDTDQFYSGEEGSLAGQAYVSLTAATQSSSHGISTLATSSGSEVPWWKAQQDHQDSFGNFENYGAVEILRWKMFSWP